MRVVHTDEDDVVEVSEETALNERSEVTSTTRGMQHGHLYSMQRYSLRT
jgi:hypothetical protein